MRRLLVAAAVACLAAPTAALAATAPASHRLVVPTDGLSPEALQAAVGTADGELIRIDEALGFAVVEVDAVAAFEAAVDADARPDARARGAADTAVARVPNDSRYPRQWGPTELNAPQAWKLQRGDPSVVVGVVDSGIDADHPDLDDVPVELGHDYVDGDSTPQDENGHGTHVAGIVAAEWSNDEGVAGMADAGLYVARVFDAQNRGWCSDIASGIREAVDAGVDVVNFSGFCSVDDPEVRDAVQYARDQGVLVVAVAGNWQDDAPHRCVAYPGRYDSVIATAAQDPTLLPADYSCRGPEVEVAAPGTRIWSTWPGGGYVTLSGTSMAAPHVSATASLLLADDPGLTRGDVRQRIAETARDLGPPGRDRFYGHGMLDPVAALDGAPVYVPGV